MDVTSHNSHFAANRGDAARADAAKSQFYRSFWRSTTISCDGQHLHSCIVASIWPFLNISTNVGSTWKMFGSDCKLFTAYWSTRFDMYMKTILFWIILCRMWMASLKNNTKQSYHSGYWLSRQKLTGSERFWKLQCRKSARRCGAKHIWKSKMLKTDGFGALLEVAWSCNVEKVTPPWHEAHFEVKSVKNWGVRSTFGVLRGRRKGFCTLSKVSQTCGCCGISQNDGRPGTFEEDLHRCISRSRRITRDISIRYVQMSGGDFLRWFAFWSIRSSGLLKWCCVTGAALRMTRSHFFVAGTVLERDGVDKSQNALVRGRQLCSGLSILMEVSQNCFVFEVVNLENGRSLAELLRFGTSTHYPTLHYTRRQLQLPLPLQLQLLPLQLQLPLPLPLQLQLQPLPLPLQLH